MKQAQELCDVTVYPDDSGYTTKWVCDGLNEDVNWVGANLTLSIKLKGELIGGLIYNDLRPNVDVWWTIYTTDKRWASRHILRYCFDVAFNLMNCRRISLFVSKDNHKSLNLVEKLGFKREGLLRQYRDDGSDCYLYGMLKNECKWRSK